MGRFRPVPASNRPPSCKEAAHVCRHARATELLLQSDEEFRELALKHHDLDDRLHDLSTRAFLSDTEQLEEVQLKKKKLQVKDKMEDMLRKRREV